MQKIIVDTNVFVSSLIQKSYPYLIVNGLFIEQKIQLCISDELMSEYYTVLSRKKFSKYPDFVLASTSLLADIESKAAIFKPKIKLQIIPDLDDNKLLELADESKARFLITGNTNHFTMREYKRTRIVTPKEYWEAYKPE